MNLGELNKHMRKLIEEQNNSGIADFEGYSSNEMSTMVYALFEKDSPVQIRKIETSLLSSIPIFKAVKYLLTILQENTEVKLTAKGFLPTKLVAQLYAQNYYLDSHIELGITKLYKETDSNYIHFTRILAEITGAARKIKGKLSLTAKGKKFLKNDQALLEAILKTYCQKFNWAYFDAYEAEQVGKLGCGFSIFLFSKYGETIRECSFYGNKYLTAFPALKDGINPTYGTIEEYINNCYNHRMIDQFGFLTGIIQPVSKPRYDEELKIQKTALFDKLFKIIPPKQ